jgi:lysine 2,3-aminomutase
MPDGLACQTPATIRSVAGLIEAGLVPPAAQTALDAVAERYAVAIPPALASIITAPDDPIARQFVPDPAELEIAPHEAMDPTADAAFSPLPGIVHRHPDRALLKPVLACPVYCRFCFRREQVGPDGGLLGEAQLSAAYAYIAAHAEIREVILTGGDPLILSPRRLSAILTTLCRIPHIELLRIHSRAPVAEPALLTDELADAMDLETPLFFVLHANHASELTPAALTALERLRRRGIPLLSQSVLLAGVNDSEAALEALFRALLRARVKPYYLHQLDPAPGTARFHVAPERGRALLRALRGKLSGTALPIYVLDQPGGLGKIPL